MISFLNESMNMGRAGITTFLGVENRKDALRGADFVINAVQVGGYEPCTVIDFEVPCIADAAGIHPVHVGELPLQLAAMNVSNIYPQLLTIEAAYTGNKDALYHAAMMDPVTGAQLSTDEIVNLCNDLIEAHAKAGFPIFLIECDHFINFKNLY